MSALAIVKTPEQTTDLEEARAAFDQVNASCQALVAKRDGIELALAVEKSGLHPDASAELRGKAAAYKDYVKQWPKRALQEIEDLDVEIDAIKLDLAAAAARLQVVSEREADKHAATIVPRHREAVGAIAKALEVLSAALAAEEAIQLEFAEAMPMHPRSARIPAMSAWFGSCRLDVPTSIASSWARAAKGLLAKAPKE